MTKTFNEIPTGSHHVVKRSSGKSAPITISTEIQQEIRKYKHRLMEMAEYDEVRDIDKISLRVILEELEPYDQYLLLAYYALQLSPSQLAKCLNISTQVLSTRINKIQTYVRNRVIDSSL